MLKLRAHAIAHTLFPPTTPQAAVDRLGFVQADPIRAPAPAQELILRHRVEGYRLGDLDRDYESLDIEEGYLYAYGYLPRSIWHLRQRAWDSSSLPETAWKILDTIRESGPTHPKEIEKQFGSARAKSGWGRNAKEITVLLDRLRYRGLLRVVRRENGVRICEASPPLDETISPDERLRRLILVEANVLAPVDARRLQSLAGALRRISFPQAREARTIIREMLQSGELGQATADGITYLWPASERSLEEPPRRVRFLAPFDPLVWDRYRFEHFWGWAYRFEAYTPAAKRTRGHYAMPVLWGEEMIGWANAVVAGGKLNVDLGFVDKRPADRDFKDELEAEIARMEAFLGLP